MMKQFFLGVVTAAVLVALPLDAFAQRGGGRGNGGGGRGNGGGSSFSGGGSVSRGSNWGGGGGYSRNSGTYISPGGISFGTGSGRVTLGNPYGYGYGGYGGYGRYGYPYGYGGWGGYGSPYYSGYRGYGNNYYYSQPRYYAQPSTQYSQPTVAASAPYDGPGVTIRNMSDQTLSFTLDDTRRMEIHPGDTQKLMSKGQFVIAFDRGSGSGQARYTVHEGTYAFTPTDAGWELFRQKTNAIAADQNPDPMIRTAERPRREDDIRPLDNRELRDREFDNRDVPRVPRPMDDRELDRAERPVDDALPPELD